MRTLILMRHAKSDWANSALTDHERPLNARGRREAPVAASRLRGIGVMPTAVFSSSSTRTRETWDEMWSVFPEVTPTFHDALYLGGLDEIRGIVEALPDSTQTVLCLGHNPGFSLTASWLSGVHVMLKTSNAAVLTIDSIHWSEGFQRGAWRLTHQITPKS